MAGKYWIKAISEWAPEEPVIMHTNFNSLIKDIKDLHHENIELKKQLENAVATIHYLDYKITELKAELSLLKEEK